MGCGPSSQTTSPTLQIMSGTITATSWSPAAYDEETSFAISGWDDTLADQIYLYRFRMRTTLVFIVEPQEGIVVNRAEV